MVSHQRSEHLRLSQDRFSDESLQAGSGVDETPHINLSCSLIRKTLVNQICFFLRILDETARQPLFSMLQSFEVFTPFLVN